jgi:carboxyl-terminal processing protease
VSHFGLIPSELSPALRDVPASKSAATGSDAGSIGVSLRLAEGQLVVWKVDSGGPAWISGVRPGQAVTRIDAVSIADEIGQLAKISDSSVRRQAQLTAVMRANSLLAGSLGDTIALTLQAHGENVAHRIGRGEIRGRMLRFGNLPAIKATVDVSETAVDGTNGARRVGVLAFSVWLPLMASDIDRAFDRLRNMDGIVIDLRGNPGGLAGMAGGVAGHMLDSTYLIGTLRQRVQTLSIRANPRRVSMTDPPVRVTPYAGPVAILMDPLSGSTSEFFAAGLQGLGRAHIVGETSAGKALPALMDRLPNDDVLMHVIADLTDSKGRRVEGVGVIPDEYVPLRISALEAGRDEALEAALRWVAAQPRSHK